ncbi:MAG: S-adenosylmethionine decarboxylase [Deltaproteobacteria bacterium]|nr:S-adenosylmethionine decarboxylase [Deltaproteobacteria bacterium]
MTALGWHYLLDAECDGDEAPSAERLGAALRDIPSELGLNRVSEPVILPPGASGILAGVVLIAESHLSVHVVWSERRLHADLFSCRRFDPAAVRQAIGARFRLVRLEDTLIERGRGTR